MKITISTLVLLMVVSLAAAQSPTLEFAGYLGNPGNVHIESVGDYSVGPVYDGEKGLLFASAGRGRINAYRLDGTQVASYLLPDAEPFARFDNMVYDGNGNVLVLAGGSGGDRSRGSIFRIKVGAPDGSVADKVPGLNNINGMSASARDGKVILHRARHPFLELDATTFEVREAGPPPGGTIGDGNYFCVLDWGPDGDIYWIYRHWELHRFTQRDGQLVEVIDEEAGWPRNVQFNLHRGRIIGDILWGLAGYDTIMRWDARGFRPAPGVVHGGTSGSFLGKVDLNHEISPDGIAPIRDGLFAISARHNGSIYFLQWNPETAHLDEVRRIGTLLSSDVLLLDSRGMVYTDNLVWNFDDDSLAVPRFTYKLRKNYAGVVIDDGTTVVAAKEGDNLDFRNGRLHSEMEVGDRRISGRDLDLNSDSAGTLYRKAGSQLYLLRVAKDGKAVEFRLKSDATIDKAVKPRPVQFENRGLPVSSAVMLADGNVLAAIGGKLHRFSLMDNGNFSHTGSLNLTVGVNAVLAVDGNRICIVDPDAGTLRLADGSSGTELVAIDGLKKPSNVAFRDGRICVYESGAQRIAKYMVSE